MPIADLLALSEESQQRQERSAADLFYAESWALTEMLATSAGYAPGFQKLIALAGSGTPGLDALTATYAKTADDIAHDLRVWVDGGAAAAIQLPEVSTGTIAATVSDVSALASRLLLAQLLLAAGEFDRAEERFSALAQDAPDSTGASAEVSAGLGMIALRKGDAVGARRAWKRAIDQGITDATLC